MGLKAKFRQLYIAKMLYEQTDEDHFLTIEQIEQNSHTSLAFCNGFCYNKTVKISKTP